MNKQRNFQYSFFNVKERTYSNGNKCSSSSHTLNLKATLTSPRGSTIHLHLSQIHDTSRISCHTDSRPASPLIPRQVISDSVASLKLDLSQKLKLGTPDICRWLSSCNEWLRSLILVRHTCRAIQMLEKIF